MTHAQTSPPPLPSAGDHLGQYEVVRRAGAGGMGVVYLARDTDLDRPVALKVLHGAGDGPGAQRERFVHEARSAARLSHPHVAAVYHVGHHAGVTFVVMEWVEGTTLAEHLRDHVCLDWREATAAVRDAAAGLAAAHRAGVVHRDVKPANLMRAAVDGRVKVVDFGLARRHDLSAELAGGGGGEWASPAWTGEGSSVGGSSVGGSSAGGSSAASFAGASGQTVIIGTPAYLSPEQCRGERGTPRSDVYALGCTYYHLLTSRPPFDPGDGLTGLIRRHQADPFPDARRLVDDVPPAVLAVLAKATQKDPADRYPDAAAMLADLDAVLAADPAAAAAAAVDVPNNLPQPTTTFVGRDRELAAVKSLLGRHRLVTLLGPGGAGKTRLAVRAAGDLLGRCPDGAWFVDLAAVTAGDAVAMSVAAAVGARPAGRQDVTAAVVDHLAAHRGLLVVDNCEHVLAAAAAAVEAVLAGCPHVRVVATSRAPLAVAGEAEYRVPPLSSPPANGAAVTAADLRPLEAVRLLADRAALVRPGFAVTDANAADVAAVCRRLDGIPLAVELAAARLKVLSVRQLADRLGDALGVLTAGPRAAPHGSVVARQRTLRAVLDWSHDLLAPAERVALARLSVFAGSASLEAAEAVLPGDPIAPADVLDLVAALVDQSLVVVEERDGRARYRLLDLVRHYAAERLDRGDGDGGGGGGDRAAVEARHLAHFAALAESTYGPLSGPDGPAVLAQLDAEHDNFRAALDRGGGTEQAQRLLGNLSRYWLQKGNLAEGLARSRAVLAAAAGLPDTPHTADACNTAGVMAYNNGLLPEAFDRYAAGLVAARRFGDVAAEATALTTLSTVLKERGDMPAARAHAEAALALRQAHGTPSAVAGAMNNLANLLTRLPGETDAGRDMYRQAQAIYRRLGDATWVSHIDMNLGILELEVGDVPAARSHYAAAADDLGSAGNRWSWAYAVQGLGECDLADGDLPAARRRMTEALAVCQEVGDRTFAAESRLGLSRVTLAEGDPVAAAALARESLRVCLEIDDPTDTALALDTLAAALAPTDPAAAAACLGAAAAARDAHGIVPFGSTLAAHRSAADAACSRLAGPAFDAALAAGRTLPNDALPDVGRRVRYGTGPGPLAGQAGV